VQKPYAQLSPAISQYSFNAFLLNPAAAGSEGYTTINLTARRQWICIPGAPETVSIDFQTRIYKRVFIPSTASVRKKYVKPQRSGRVGLGCSFINDRHGAFDQKGLKLSYAYHVPGNRSQLSFGLALSMLLYKINYNEMVPETEHDDLLNNGQNKFFVPDFDAGIYYTNQHLFAGISVKNLTRMAKNLNFYPYEGYQQRIISIIGGYQFKLSESVGLEPSFYVKNAGLFFMQTDLNVKLAFKDILWSGVTYRSPGTMCFQGGFRLNRVYIGYAYEYNLFMRHEFCFSTHELMVAAKLGDNVRRYKWLERY
jgi:type IX secretion system PorP/SprF family membrane protein